MSPGKTKIEMPSCQEGRQEDREISTERLCPRCLSVTLVWPREQGTVVFPEGTWHTMYLKSRG